MKPIEEVSMRYIFIGGAHKSGSTLLGRILSQSANISAFECTGAPMDEGQWLQNVLIQDVHVGELLFGLSEESHLTESDLIRSGIDSELLSCWNNYWNTKGEYFLEKSPINVLRTRFLQAIFPDSAFLITIRDPRTSYMAAKKTMPHVSFKTYLKNWHSIYSTFKKDSNYLKSYAVIHYESLLKNPQNVLEYIKNTFGLEIDLQSDSRVCPSVDFGYIKAWKSQYKGKYNLPNLFGYGGEE